MKRVLGLLLFLGVVALPFSARAQSPIKFSTLQVQLWPEYDQPSMLVIYDFRLPDSIKLPVSVTISFPKEGHLVAVASQAANGSLLNTDYIGPTPIEASQAITIQVQTPTTYHVEYYEPLTRKEKQREFSYIWPGDYAVDDLSVSVRIPPETTSMATDPQMQSSKAADDSDLLIKDFGGFKAGERFTLQITYSRSTDAPSQAQQGVQPSQPLGSSTPGRVLLSNYLPYILGGLGIVAIGAAAVYFLQPRHRPGPGRRRSHGSRAEGKPGKDVYCHQCGARAQAGDRFCRVCGTRLQIEE